MSRGLRYTMIPCEAIGKTARQHRQVGVARLLDRLGHAIIRRLVGVLLGKPSSLSLKRGRFHKGRVEQRRAADGLGGVRWCCRRSIGQSKTIDDVDDRALVDAPLPACAIGTMSSPTFRPCLPGSGLQAFPRLLVIFRVPGAAKRQARLEKRQIAQLRSAPDSFAAASRSATPRENLPARQIQRRLDLVRLDARFGMAIFLGRPRRP